MPNVSKQAFRISCFDQGIEFYKTSVLPDLEALDGFCSASLLVDRASGRAVACSSFDSLEAMERRIARISFFNCGIPY